MLQLGPGWFLRIARNTGNHWDNKNFHKSDQTVNQTKRDNKLCLRKISLQKTLRTRDSGFSNVFYGKKGKPGNAGNQQKAF